MIINIYLMRHGKMQSKKSLTSKAKNYSQRMGCKLSQTCPKFDKVFFNGTASKITANKMLKAGGFALENVHESTFGEVFFTDLSTMDNILIVATAKDIVKILKKYDLKFGTKLGQCSVIRISLCDVCNIIEEVFEAKELAKKFPFKNGKTLEYRDRPAYYYTQSAAVPYRMKAGELEVLLITSSSGKKWGVPKGVAEPDLTMWDSAAQEALEEAGVKGEISETAMGSFNIEKWGGNVQVTVYPLKVNVTLSKWDEADRSRKWLSLDNACSIVTCPELKKIIAKLSEVLEPKGVLNA